MQHTTTARFVSRRRVGAMAAALTLAVGMVAVDDEPADASMQCYDLEGDEVPCWPGESSPCEDSVIDDDFLEALCNGDSIFAHKELVEVTEAEGGGWDIQYLVGIGRGSYASWSPYSVTLSDSGAPGATFVTAPTDPACENPPPPLLPDSITAQGVASQGLTQWSCTWDYLEPGAFHLGTTTMHVDQCGAVTNTVTAAESSYLSRSQPVEIGEGATLTNGRPPGDISGRGGIVMPGFSTSRSLAAEPASPASDQASVTVDIPCAQAPPAPAPVLIPGVDVTTTASPSSGVGPGDTVTFTTVVTNTGETTLRNLAVTNDVGSSGPGFTQQSAKVLVAPAGYAALGTSSLIEVIARASNVDLAPGGTITTTSTYVVTEADLPGPLTATVRVSAIDGTSDTVTSLVGLVSAPALVLELSPDAPSATWSATAPPSITWTYVLRNVGDVTLTGLTLSDSAGIVGLGGVQSLAPGQSTTTTATRSATSGDALAGEVVNAATATGLTSLGGFVEGLASSTVTLLLPEPAAPAPEPEPATEVLGEVVEREPAPAPAPVVEAAPALEAAPAVETLPATGRFDAATGATGLLLAVLGLLALVATGPRTVASSGRRKD